MGPQKFYAASTAEALRMVREKMGSDALVLSSRDTDEGVEVVAISPDALAFIANQRNALSPTPTKPGPSPLARFTEEFGSPLNEQWTNDAVPAAAEADPVNVSAEPPSPPPLAATNEVRAQAPAQSAAQPVAHSTAQPATQAADPAQMERLYGEIESVKKLLQSQVAGNYWGEIQQRASGIAEITKAMLTAGFSPKLVSDLVQELDQSEADSKVLQEQLQRRLEERIRVVNPMDMFDAGGVFAFIGPTGVGKTTTVAKVAARCILRYGRDEVALLSTDTYRIGAQEQLKVFAKILGLPIISLRDSEDLSAKINDLSPRKIILLDTAGVNQRDSLMLEQSQLIQHGSRTARRILVMSATTDLRTQEDVIMLNRQALQQTEAVDGSTLFGAIITKIDEAALVGPVVDCLIRHDLPVLFLSNGQRVPEDLSQANAAYLAHRALRPRHLGTNLDVTDELVPSLMADYLNDWMSAGGH